ncbi:MAG: ferredoxin [Clostridiales bacterium]|nr:ferredoxin [Clostridiales bacterium]MCF8021900.1 ferredoxin [Clostridiales bacterium]
MKMEVDQDLCISCGACIDACPEVFDWNDDEKACVKVDEVPSNIEDQAEEAMESCPTEAIIKK